MHKQDPTFCCIQEKPLSVKESHYFRVKDWKTIFKANGPKKQAGRDILILNKNNFHQGVFKKDEERHFSLNFEYLCTGCKGDTFITKIIY